MEQVMKEMGILSPLVSRLINTLDNFIAICKGIGWLVATLIALGLLLLAFLTYEHETKHTLLSTDGSTYAQNVK